MLNRRFDRILSIAILASVIVVCIGSVPNINPMIRQWLYVLEWVFTGIFTLEYIIRIKSARKPLRYVFSFFGLVDLVSTLPSYLALFLPVAHSFLVIRILRLLRIFRVLKLANYTAEANFLITALFASRRKISIFLVTVMSIVLVVSTVMYLVEGPENGFDSIPRAMYWAIVTITTVGYGDIAPHTVLGQVLASFLMLIGYTIIAVPTGILSSEMMKSKSCPSCGHKIE